MPAWSAPEIRYAPPPPPLAAALSPPGGRVRLPRAAAHCGARREARAATARTCLHREQLVVADRPARGSQHSADHPPRCDAVRSQTLAERRHRDIERTEPHRTAAEPRTGPHQCARTRSAAPRTGRHSGPIASPARRGIRATAAGVACDMRLALGQRGSGEPCGRPLGAGDADGDAARAGGQLRGQEPTHRTRLTSQWRQLGIHRGALSETRNLRNLPTPSLSEVSVLSWITHLFRELRV